MFILGFMFGFVFGVVLTVIVGGRLVKRAVVTVGNELRAEGILPPLDEEEER